MSSPKAESEYRSIGLSLFRLCLGLLSDALITTTITATSSLSRELKMETVFIDYFMRALPYNDFKKLASCEAC
jgi:hypothetical protein